jgi:hypothetical protein
MKFTDMEGTAMETRFLQSRLLRLTLAAFVLLPACAPTIQTANGAYQPTTAIDGQLYISPHLPATEINDQTPNDSYATFDDCFSTGVSVGDVRRLGVEVADKVCRETARNLTTFIAVDFTIALALGIFLVKDISNSLNTPQNLGEPGIPTGHP